MNKALKISLTGLLFLLPIVDMFVLHNKHTLLTLGVFVLFFSLSYRIKSLYRLGFMAALFFLIVSVVLYYFIQAPYYRASADWVFYFLIIGFIQLAFETQN